QDVLGDLAQHQLALHGLEFPVQGDELAQRGTGHELDVPEVQEDLPAAEFVHQTEQVVPDHLDVLLVEDLLVHEVDDRDVTHVLDLEAARGGGPRGGHVSPSSPGWGGTKRKPAGGPWE